MKVLGVDPSLTGTGLALPSGEVLTIKTKKKGCARLVEIRDIVAGAARDADLVVIEGYAMQARGRAVFPIGELGGVLRVALWEQDSEYLEIPPSVLKKFATGKGNADKTAMAFALAARTQGTLTLEDDNQVDAWWLQAVGLHLHGLLSFTLPKAQTDAIDKLVAA